MDNSDVLAAATPAAAPSSQLPMGTIVAYGLKAKVPDGWLLCDGSTIPTKYQALISALGSGNTPNLVARTLIGSGTTPITNLPQTNGTTPNFPPSASFDLTNTGGEYVHKLTTDEMPDHTHTINSAGGGFGLHYQSFKGNTGNDQPFENNPDGKNVKETDSSGKGASHNTMQPYYVVSYIIYTGT